MIRVLSLVMLLIGCLWGLAIAWAYVSLSGISGPVSMRAVFIEYGLMLLPPGLMVAGSISILRGAALRPSAIVIGLSCLVLTGIVAYQIGEGLRPEPLQVRPPYVFYAAIALLVLLADAGALKLVLLTGRSFTTS